METQGTLREACGANGSAVTSGIPLVVGSPNSGPHSPIPPAPLFNGFHGAANQSPFLYSQSYRPPIPGYGFTAPTQGTPSATIDLMEESPKRGPQRLGS